MSRSQKILNLLLNNEEKSEHFAEYSSILNISHENTHCTGK